MIKKILPIAFLLYSTASFASPDFIAKYGSDSWIKVFEESNEKDYYTLKGIYRDGNTAQIVELRDFSVEQMDGGKYIYKTKFHLYQFQCREGTFKVLYTQTRQNNMGKGAGVFEDSIPTPTYTGIREGTSVYQLWRIACFGG